MQIDRKWLNCTFGLLVIAIVKFWYHSFQLSQLGLPVSQWLRLGPLTQRCPIFNTKSLCGTRETDLTLSHASLTLMAWQRPSHIKEFKQHVCVALRVLPTCFAKISSNLIVHLIDVKKLTA